MTKVGVFLAKIVAIVNQKGGVGKTTTCVNLTSSLKEKGNRVLLCDFDPQANSTSGMGVDKAASRGVYDVLINGADVERAVVSTKYGDVLPSNKALAGAGVEMIGIDHRETLLKQALDVLSPRYDYILIDAPAGLGPGFQYAVCGADRALVVATNDASSLRDAQHTVMELRQFSSGRLHLVVNRVRKKLLHSMHATIDDAMDKAGLPLIGVVPEDDALPVSLNQGTPLLLRSYNGAASAYRNIAIRLQGGKAPLLRIR